MKQLINLKKLIIRTIGRIFANSQNTSDMLKKKLIFTFLLLSLYSYPIIAQTVNPSQVKEAQKALAEKGIPEDEVRKRLLAQGIDLDNIKPGQMAGLEDKIKAIVAQIEKEQGTSKENAPKEGAPVKEQKVSSAAKDTVMLNQKATSNDAKSSLDPMSDKLRQQEIADQAAEDALKKKGTELSKDISQRIKEGASLQEAIMDEINEKNGKLYSNSGNVFGHEIFFNKSLDLYRKTSTSTTPDSYILDVGDKLAINIFGVSQADLIYEIEEDGFIRPSNMLKVYLKGVPIGKAKELLKNRFRQAYMFADGQFNVDLHTARTVTVSIFGEVNIQGTYTISALNTALQALMAAGGPKETGGIRTIKIVSGSSEKLLDVYDFIANPNVQFNYFLHDNDLIYVPKAGKLVTLNGSGFKTNALFELKANERFNDVTKYAGGLSTNVYKEQLQHIYKIGEQQQIKDYTYDQFSKLNPILNDGDVVVLNASLLPYENFVNINGSVRHAGNYQLSKGMKLNDVLTKAILQKETYAELAYLTRKNPDGTYQLIRLYPEKSIADSLSQFNITLQNEDYIRFFSKAELIDRFEFSVEGAVRTPGRYFWDPSEAITLYDALKLSKGLRSDATAFGYIISSPPDKPLERKYTVVDLNSTLADPTNAANIKIKPYDRLVIPSTSNYLDQFTVQVSGAVRAPGTFIYDSTLSVKDILVMAGGLKMEAASNKVDVFRLRTIENEPTETYAASLILDRNMDYISGDVDFVLQPYDNIVVRYTPEWSPIKYVTINGEVKYPGTYAIMDSKERVKSLIERSGGFTKSANPEAGTFFRSEEGLGLIVTRIDLLYKRRTKSRYNIILKEGDVVTIPKIKDVVKIDRTGTRAEEIYLANQLQGPQLNIVVNYYNRRAKWYVKTFAGGFDRDAKRGKTYVQDPNGHIRRTKNFLIFRIYPKVHMDSEVHLVLKNKAKTRRNKEKIEKEKLETTPTFKEEKEKKTPMERLMELQAIISMTSAMVTTTLTTLITIQTLKK